MKFEAYSKSFLHFYSDEVPDLLKKYWDFSSFNNVADLGAGDGALLFGLRAHKMIDDATKIIAVDISEDRYERLKPIPWVSAYHSDVTKLDFIESSSLDCVICTQVIEHVSERDLLSEIMRILKPGGVLYIASLVRSRYSWWYYKTLEGKWGLDPTHLREYESKDVFEKVISSAGFVIKETSLTKLKLSVLEFLIRRIVVPIFKLSHANEIFVKHKYLNFLRTNLNIRPLGYFIVETIGVKPLELQ
jgi:ubiquinone/menaquinone biosynthesis C-methylase UbiE